MRARFKNVIVIGSFGIREITMHWIANLLEGLDWLALWSGSLLFEVFRLVLA